ncbi:hypothetical protein SAMN04488540_12059 [Ferrimonas sediminum]|uniref:Uncharacterized protein n=2 Tax=Ferrimonas sediminum TaxID=718193 RepID=A0A1G8ZN41_9GAMM|nr:hypothetical protein SAMN04488540_12059 [Ferrimonas sediminum]
MLSLALLSQGAVARMSMMPAVDGNNSVMMAAMDCHGSAEMTQGQASDDGDCCCDHDADVGSIMNCQGGCSQCQDCSPGSSSLIAVLWTSVGPQPLEPHFYFVSFDSIYLESDERPPIV